MVKYYDILTTVEGEYYAFTLNKLSSQEKKFKSFMDRDNRLKLILDEIDPSVMQVMSKANDMSSLLKESLDVAFSNCVMSNDLKKLVTDIESLIPSIEIYYEMTNYVMMKIGKKDESEDGKITWGYDVI